MPRLFTKYQGNFIFQNRFLPIARQPNCAKKIFYPRYGTLGVQGSIWFFGAETPQSGVILVAGREPGCLVCLATSAFLLPKNSAGPAGGQKSGLARPQDEGGLNLPPRTRTQPALILAAAGIFPFVRRGYPRRTKIDRRETPRTAHAPAGIAPVS